MVISAPIDDTLDQWPDLSDRFDWSGLLIGNGASIAVWERFAYESLFQIAQRQQLDHRLRADDLAVFNALGTSNFESVLFGLRTARLVNGALGVNQERPEQAYENIRLALIEAVQWVHLPWSLLGTDVRQRIRDELLRYQRVYSTNYDLLLYWAIMLDEHAQGFKDFFWGGDGQFDPADTDVWDKSTRILYLHGGLHLETDLAGTTRKRHSQFGTNLLGSFQMDTDTQGWLPLFVSEGTSADKVGAIARSDYLSFAYQSFVEHEGPAVVFGHSLGQEDHHLLRALNAESRTLAVGILPQSSQHVIQEKGRLRGALPRHQIFFYDASTHPLGSGSLRVISPH